MRAETHRGLEGRAPARFSTGGNCHGFATVQEENPPDPEHSRKRSVIAPAEAPVVRRVFRLFAEGTSLKGGRGMAEHPEEIDAVEVQKDHVPQWMADELDRRDREGAGSEEDGDDAASGGAQPTGPVPTNKMRLP